MSTTLDLVHKVLTITEHRSQQGVPGEASTSSLLPKDLRSVLLRQFSVCSQTFTRSSSSQDRNSRASVRMWPLANLHYYRFIRIGAKPGKKYALNKQYALLSQLRLLTRVYGLCWVCGVCHVYWVGRVCWVYWLIVLFFHRYKFLCHIFILGAINAAYVWVELTDQSNLSFARAHACHIFLVSTNQRSSLKATPGWLV